MPKGSKCSLLSTSNFCYHRFTMKLLKFSPIALLITLLSFSPNAIEPLAWKTFALFASTILALILQSASMGAVGFISLSVGALIGAFTIKDAIAGFGAPLVWQIVTVFFIARGFVKTGLSKRISFHIIKFFGRNVLGLSYGFVFANFTLGPLIPSCAARIGGIIFPIVRSVSETLGSDPENGTHKKIGSFLTLLCLYGNAIVSATFLTAMAGNLIIKSLASDVGLQLTWLNWFQASCVPAFLCILTMPLLLYTIYPPQIKDISKTRKLIDQELSKLGKFSQQEKQMTIILLSILCAWVFGDYFKIDAILASFIGLSLLILFNILNFEKDLLTEKEAWHTLIWLSALLMLARTLETSGFLEFLVMNLNQMLVGYSWQMALTVLVLVYGYTHYLFASNSSHVSAMYAIFLGTAIKMGAPIMLAGLVFAFTSSLFAGLYYYTSTEAVILYNSKYVPMKDFFKYGIIITTYLFLLWMLSGIVWWKMIGLY